MFFIIFEGMGVRVGVKVYEEHYFSALYHEPPEGVELICMLRSEMWEVLEYIGAERVFIKRTEGYRVPYNRVRAWKVLPKAINIKY